MFWQFSENSYTVCGTFALMAFFFKAAIVEMQISEFGDAECWMINDIEV